METILELVTLLALQQLSQPRYNLSTMHMFIYYPFLPTILMFYRSFFFPYTLFCIPEYLSTLNHGMLHDLAPLLDIP